jgi:hypothetical protein
LGVLFCGTPGVVIFLLKGWIKDLKKNVVTFTKTDSRKNTYCVIGVYASTPSAGAKSMG